MYYRSIPETKKRSYPHLGLPLIKHNQGLCTPLFCYFMITNLYSSFCQPDGVRQ